MIERQMNMDKETYEVAVKKSLKESPIWNSLVSTVEAEVTKLFEANGTIKKKPQQPETIQLINKLISEYMDWMGYKVTNTIFMKESGTEFKANSHREQITSLLDLEDNNETLQMPLLTVLITMFKNKNADIKALND